MREHCSNEDLSAYLDGESEEAEKIGTHLQSCPQCAGLYAQMQNLSARVGVLPSVEADAFFVERATAHAAEARRERTPSWAPGLRRFALGVGLAAAILMGVFAYLAAGPRGYQANPLRAISPKTTITLGETPDAPAYPAEPEDAEDVSADDMIAELATTDWFVVLAASWDDNDDLDAMIEAMDSDEAEAFVALAREYSEKDVTI